MVQRELGCDYKGMRAYATSMTRVPPPSEPYAWGGMPEIAAFIITYNVQINIWVPKGRSNNMYARSRAPSSLRRRRPWAGAARAAGRAAADM